MLQPAAAYELPPIVRHALPNGARLLAVETHASESVVLAGFIAGGAVLDPPGREGLLNLTTAVAQRATVARAYDQIYDLLDSLGAALGMGAGIHAVSFRAKCLSRHWRIVAAMLAELLRSPSFPEAELARARGEVLTSLREIDQSTHMVASRELCRLVYPQGHPYHHPPYGRREAVEAMAREELAACHQRLFRPDALALAIVGDVAAEEALSGLAELLADWPRPCEPLPNPELAAEHPSNAQRAVFSINDKSQADIALGFKAIPRTHPDFDALDQATEILGGFGLMGRLGDNVRDRQGLAYHVSASFAEGLGNPLWAVHAGVSPANVSRAVASILDEIKRMQDQPVSEQELTDCQDNLAGSMPVHLETNDGLASTLNNIELFGLDHDYLARYPQLVRAVTSEAVQRAAQRHLTAERYSLAIAGPSASLE